MNYITAGYTGKRELSRRDSYLPLDIMSTIMDAALSSEVHRRGEPGGY